MASKESKYQLTLLEHLDELRGRLAISIGWLVVSSGVSFCFADRLLEWLKRPAGAALPRLAFFGPAEGLAAYFKLALAGGLILSLPVILYQIWAFMRPALTWRERYYGLACVSWGSVLFLAGAALAYFGCLPLFLRFLLGFGASQMEPVISVHRYLSFVLGIILFCGAFFEMPLVVFALTRLGIVTPNALRRRRAIVLLGLVIAAAVVTPTTDAVSLILVSVPLALLYEISIVVSRLALRPD
ncbi:MAG: twin-arginine translocase subunit TatC [Candidatus Omnitrophica bacterium]|nr:twin-arginine translocase subunit TatC [Candidatus Omnitrophota bacterium]